MLKNKIGKIKKLKLILLILIIPSFFGIVSQVEAEILFRENFDNQPDWHNNCERSSGNSICGCVVDNCIDRELPGWDFWNVDEMWNPDVDGDNSRPQISIGSENARSGKCIIFSPESHRGRSGDGWGSDGILQTHFEATKELWIEFWMKRQLNFQWHDNNEDGSGIKTLRIGSDNGTRPFSFSFSENVLPAYIYKYGHKSAYFLTDTHDHSPRCSEIEHYYCNGDYNSLAVGEGYPIDTGDGNYHKYTWHFIMNSGDGIADGVLEHYIDNQLVKSKYDIAWIRTSNNEKFWNEFGIGGNIHNGQFSSSPPDKLVDASGMETEGWYAIDDICVSTLKSDLNTCFNNPIEIRADVDQNSTINSTDAMLTLRNSLGLDMSNTNWVTGTHTGDVNCDDSSNSTDAMLILRKSLGLDMTGTGWCID